MADQSSSSSTIDGRLISVGVAGLGLGLFCGFSI